MFKKKYFTIKISITITQMVLVVNSTLAQYTNPPFSGSKGDGMGGIGTLGAGNLFGYLNPAGCLADYLTFNYSAYTGVYSDWILFPPTMKNLSIRYPVVSNVLTISGMYGMADDNELYLSANRDLWGNEKLNTYYRYDMGINISYQLPVSKYTDKLEVYSGIGIKKYWRWWASNSMKGIDYGGGISFRTGLLLNLRVNPKLTLATALVLQPNSLPWGPYNTFPGFYGGGIGFNYYFNLEKNHYLNFSSEMILPYDWNISKSFKIGGGISYHFPSIRERSIQLGIFSYPYDPTASYLPVYWTTIGFTYEMKYFTISTAWMDAFNLDLGYRSRSDVGKIISFSVDIPIRNQKLKKLRLGNSRRVRFYNPKYLPQRVKIGEMTSATIYLQNCSIDTLASGYIYANILPNDGMVLHNKMIPINKLSPGEIKKIDIPFESIKNYHSQYYTLKTEYVISSDNTQTKNIGIHTIEPILSASLRIRPYKQFLVVPTPGCVIISVCVNNSGNVRSDSLQIVFPEEFKDRGFMIETKKIIPVIRPGRTETVDFILNFIDQTRPGDNDMELPISVTFKEKNGYEPSPYYTTLHMINRKLIDTELLESDPFINNFKDFLQFYVVFDITAEQYHDLKTNTHYHIDVNANFPGKLCIGPYETLAESYENYLSLINKVKGIDIYAVNRNRVESISRFFISVPNITENVEKIRDIELYPIFSSAHKYQSFFEMNKILIGPFRNLIQTDSALEFIDKHIANTRVITCFPNEVRLFTERAMEHD